MASVLAVLFLLSAGIAGAQTTSNQDFSAKARIEQHFQHEDRIYGTQSTSGAAMERHFNHEDVIYGARKSESRAVPLRTVTAASNGFDRMDMLFSVGAAFVVLLVGTAAVFTARRGRSGAPLSEF
jgi:hypothetical protein